MAAVRVRAVEDPFATPELSRSLVEALMLADAMGLLPQSEVVEALDLATARRVARAVSSVGVAQSAVATLLATLRRNSHRTEVDAAELRSALEGLRENLEQSPVPEFEWRSLLRIFDADELASLVDTSPTSLRRYAAGARVTPDEVAERLHFLARIVGDLRGSYNDIGIRRWFERKRVALDGRTPRQLLRRGWRHGDPGADRVRELARSLVASPAT